MKWSVRRGACSLLLLICLLAVRPARGQKQDIDELLERANAAQSSANYAEAADLYAQATRLSPATPELWSNRGVMEFLSGEKSASIMSLKHATQLNPNLFTPMVFLGKAYVETNKAAEAVPFLRRAHSLKPDDVEVLLALGNAYADLDRPRAAASFYANASEIAPQQAGAWFGLGVSSLKVIEADGREMATTQPQSIWARSLFADELLTQGRPIEAVATYKASLAKASPMQKATLVQMLQWMQSHPNVLALPAISQDALEKLTTELGSEKDSAAVPACATADHETTPVRRSAASVTFPLHEAACAYRAGDYKRSAEEAGRALQRSPQDAEILYWSIKANERVAVAALSQFEQMSVHSAAGYVLVGNLYRSQRQPDNALNEYKKALALDAHDPSALMGGVLACVAANKLDEAASLDEIALADRPLDPQLNLLMAEILDAQGQRRQEETFLAKASTAPAALQPRVHYLLGRVYSEDGKTDEAIKQYELALPGDTDGSMHYQLSRLYRKTGNVAKAEDVLAQAKALIGKRDTSAFTAVREATPANP